MNANSHDGAIAIFVKTPGRSPIKTRLAAAMGESAASSWFCAAAHATCAVARIYSARSGAAVYWAIAEHDAMRDAIWSDLPTLAQGLGGLGERMANVHDELVERHGSGILIGADAPQLSVDELLRANQWLRNPDPRCVIGPALDGGFWLTGANRKLPISGWTAPHYSCSDTAELFRKAMKSQGDWLTLSSLADVDHVADLPRLVKALEDQIATSPNVLLPEQHKLLNLSRELQANSTCSA